MGGEVFHETIEDGCTSGETRVWDRAGAVTANIKANGRFLIRKLSGNQSS